MDTTTDASDAVELVKKLRSVKKTILKKKKQVEMLHNRFDNRLMSDPALMTPMGIEAGNDDDETGAGNRNAVTSLYRLGVSIGKKMKAIEKLEEALFDMV